VNRFLAPAAIQELDSQPIEQFRMLRALALRAEVFAGFDDSVPEVLVQNATEFHSSCLAPGKASGGRRRFCTRRT